MCQSCPSVPLSLCKHDNIWAIEVQRFINELQWTNVSLQWTGTTCKKTFPPECKKMCEKVFHAQNLLDDLQTPLLLTRTIPSSPTMMKETYVLRRNLCFGLLMLCFFLIHLDYLLWPQTDPHITVANKCLKCFFHLSPHVSTTFQNKVMPLFLGPNPFSQYYWTMIN